VERAAASSPPFGRIEALAYEREDAAVYHEWCRFDAQARRAALADRCVLLSVVTHAAGLIAEQARGSDRFVCDIQSLLRDIAADTRAAQREFPLEWFQALDRWVAASIEHLYFDAAAQALQLAFDSGASRYPGLFQALRASEAELCARSGQLSKAAEIALWYARRPYLLPEHRKLPQIYPRLMAALLHAGHIDEHRMLLWRGLREAYLASELRDWFAARIRRTYRGYLNALSRSEVRFDDRVQLLLHLAFLASRRMAPCRLLRIDRLLYWLTAALGYALVARGARPSGRPRAEAQVNAILVTRAMGGIGDLLTMTPGLRALALAHPGAEIHFAIPRQFMPLFEGNDDFVCVDIESATLDPARYRAWFDLTDCPAARIESRQAPNVRVNRIELFARRMGVPAYRLQGPEGRPRYVIAPAEQLSAEREARSLRRGDRPLVGLQWQAAESYKDYPHKLELLRLLATRCDVLVFSAHRLADPAVEGVRLVARPLRDAFALASQCDVLVGPDSSFLHLAGALDKPMVFIAGPVDGALRAKPYPSVVPVVPKRMDFPCAPCWRNENINCYLSGRRESVCLRSIAPATVAAEVLSLLDAAAAVQPRRAAPALQPVHSTSEGTAC
jgi:ADP-heptose:LPS heptosyltransferase